MRIVVVFFLLVSVGFTKGYQPFLSFTSSVSALIGIYSQHKVLPLSGLTYYFSTQGCSLDGLVDGLSKEAEVIRWRHLIPESVLGQGMECMTHKICQSTLSDRLYSGARCCRKSSLKFKKMASDLHNIIPTVLKEGTESLIRLQDIHDKGSIARSYLYMIDTYKLNIEDDIRLLCQKWDKKYPVSAWEKRKNRKIFKLQGTFNPYIEKL